MGVGVGVDTMDPTEPTVRILWFSVSAINIFPWLSEVIALGLFRLALIAGPSSPANENRPSPAIVVMIPVFASIIRTRLSIGLVITILPWRVTFTSLGKGTPALVAWPPSPEKTDSPFPATVVMIPVLKSTLRIRWFPVSAIYMFSFKSTETPSGKFRDALVASPKSPVYPDCVTPATVVIFFVW